MQDLAQVVTNIFKNLCMVQNVPNAIQFFNAKHAEGRNFHKVLRTYFKKGPTYRNVCQLGGTIAMYVERRTPCTFHSN